MKDSNTEHHGRNEVWSRASFRIVGDTLDPKEISSCLGLEATSSGVKGELVRNGFSAVRPTSVWALRCPLDKLTPLEEHLKWLLDRTEPKVELISSVAAKWYVEFFCGYISSSDQVSIQFNPDIMCRLAHMKIPITIDVHVSGEE